MPHHGSASDFKHRHFYLGDHHRDNERRTLWVVALTGATMGVEVLAGFAFNSMALLADGIHMATHAGALGLAAAAYAFARRHADDPRFSFGTGKVGDLAGFASALVLAVIALAILVESVGRLFEPRPVAFTEAATVAVLGLIVNIMSAVLLGGGHQHDHPDHGGDHLAPPGHTHVHWTDEGDAVQRMNDESHPGQASFGHCRLEHDNNLQAAFAHVAADALTSVLAIGALVGGRFLGWPWLDPAVGILGAIVISAWAWRLMRETAFVLVDGSDPGLTNRVQRLVMESGYAQITDLHVWRVGPGAHAVIVSMVGERPNDSLRERLTSIPELTHVTIESR